MNNPFQSFFRKKNQPEINQISQTKSVAKKAIRYVEMGMSSNIEDVYGLREKSIDYKSLVGSVSTAPAFETFAKMYQTYHYISTPIDRLVDEVVSLQPIFKKDGQEVEVEKLNSDILDTIVTHLIVFGQAIIAKGKTPRVLASSDINLWRMKGGEITAFNYLIENKNFTFEKPSDDFKIFTYKKFNSPFFGTSPLKALYDEIFKVKLDAINTQDDFDHNARMGSIIIEPENISENSSLALKEAVKKLSDTRYRYSSQVLPHGTEVRTLEQTLVESLSKDEKERIERVCANQIGYPYQFLSSESNGLGRGEQTTLRINLGVRVNKIQNIIKEIYEYLYNIKDEGIEMSFEEFKINSQSEMITSATELVLAGILTPAEMKTKYLGYTEDTLRPIDKEGYIPNSIRLESEKTTTPETQPPSIVQSLQDNIIDVPVEKVKSIIKISDKTKEHAKKFYQKNIVGKVDLTQTPLHLAIQGSNKAVANTVMLTDLLDEQTRSKADFSFNDIIGFSMATALNYVLDEYLKVFGEYPDQGKIETIYNNLSIYLSARNSSLLGQEVITEIPDDLSWADILLPQSLQEAGDKKYQFYMGLGLSTDEAKQKVLESTEDRASFIIANEIAKATNFAIAESLNQLGGQKTWLLTKAKFPRVGNNDHLIHVELVGKTIPAKSFFNCSDGTRDYTAGQRIGCRCGCIPTFKKEIELN